MRSFVIMALAVILLGGSAVFLNSAAYAEDASIVRVTEVNGTVTRNGTPVKEGDVIQRDDVIGSKEKSSAVLTWSNGSIVEVYPDTLLNMRGIIFEGDRKLEKTLLTLEKGRIFAKAQVPEHLFSHFEISVGNIPVMAQGAEFALKYDDAEKKYSIWSLLGTVVVDMGIEKVRVDEGQQADLKIGGKPESTKPIQDKTKDVLLKTSRRLGGSLLIEEDIGSSGGPLKIKIGGVKYRRGSAPYTVKFKALVGGGSGKVKAIRWDFGDGENAAGKESQHTFTQGVYVVILSIEDENGQKATAQINISVEQDCGC